MKEMFNLDDSSSLGTSIRERCGDGAQETSGCVPLMFLGTHCSREREQQAPALGGQEEAEIQHHEWTQSVTPSEVSQTQEKWRVTSLMCRI